PFPDAAGGFAELRRAMHASERPLMVVVSASGDLDLKTPALAEGAPVVILTTRAGAKCLAGAPTHLRIRALERTTAAEILKATVDETGGKLILTEGGPTLLGHFLRERSLDDLFLTIAPRIVGRDATARRLALVEGAAFAPGEAPESRLARVKTAGDYLFLRFARRTEIARTPTRPSAARVWKRTWEHVAGPPGPFAPLHQKRHPCQRALI